MQPMFSKNLPSKTSRFAFLAGVALLLRSAAVAAGPSPDMLGASPSSRGESPSDTPPPDSPPPDAPPPDAPPMPEAALRETIPDIVIQRAPPALLVAPFVGTRWPYQATSFGVDLDLRLWPWLRVGGGYALGLSGSADRKELVVTNYAEAFMGLRILHGTGETTVNLPVKSDPPAQTGPVRALVPSDHALFLEGGIITGFVAAQRCLAKCDALPESWSTPPSSRATLQSDDHQVVLPFAGLRYVYFYSASSKRQTFRKRAFVQLFAHFIGQPLTAPTHDLFIGKGDRIERSRWGGRGGFDTPLCFGEAARTGRCPQIGLVVGANPFPKDVIFEFHVGYAVD
jgi:hypothetical protein